jgi:sugar-phosphatase
MSPEAKPAPDGYWLAAQRLGSEPTACVAFEDAPAGLVAALEAGTRVVALTTTHLAEQLRGADATIPDFSGVIVRSSTEGMVFTIGAARA